MLISGMVYQQRGKKIYLPQKMEVTSISNTSPAGKLRVFVQETQQDWVLLPATTMTFSPGWHAPCVYLSTDQRRTAYEMVLESSSRSKRKSKWEQRLS